MRCLWRVVIGLAMFLCVAGCKEGEQRFDFDEDGWEDSIDCDPEDPHTYPGAPERPDCVDNNCDGVMDEGTTSIDSDLDGYCVGVERGDITTCCDDSLPGDCSDIDASLHPVDTDGDGYSPCDGDCDEGNDDVHPDAEEICDGLDSNCDGEAGELDESDGDGDGYPACGECDDTNADINPGVIDLANDGIDTNCDGVDGMDTDGDGFASRDSGGEDCNDLDPEIYPGAEELCDGLDNDCDDYLDEGLAVDQDGDGYNSCSGECDDTDPLVYPGAPELCDNVDNDCDGIVPADETDGDGDGVMICGGDCDDADDRVNPAAAEICADGADNDCDGATDGAGCIDCTAWVPGDYPNIQAAANGASVGETICVEPGTYHEHVELSVHDAGLIAVAGPGATAIDGSGTGRPLKVGPANGTILVQGFTLSNGNAPIEAVTGGGGLRIDSTAVVLRDLILIGNHSDTGAGGMLCYVCDADMENLTFQGNTADATGGGAEILFSISSGNHLRFEGNESSSHGGGLYLQSTDLTVDDLQLVDNTSLDGYGGGLAAYTTTLVADHPRATGNWARWAAGAMHISSNCDLTLTNGQLLDNEVFTWGGGGVYLWTATARIENTVVAGNSVNGDGGGISIWEQSTLTAVNTIITGNTAMGGEGVFVDQSTATFDHCDIWGNGSEDVGGIVSPVGQDGNVAVDPQFLDNSDPDILAWDLHLSDTSPLIEAGTQALADPDNSGSDVGCYGGPDADGFDRDQDGYYEWWQPGDYDFGAYPALDLDCDDGDPLIYPGQGC